MKKTTIILITYVFLSGCGSHSEKTSTPTNETTTQLTPAPALPNSPQPKPSISYDDQLLFDIEEFVKAAHSIQYFYPSEETKNSTWPLFIAESIIELSQTEVNNRAERGITLLRQIAPYIAQSKTQLPKIDDNTQVSVWWQDGPIQQDVHTRNLMTQSYGNLKNQDYMGSNLHAELNYYQETFYFPLYLPVNAELKGQTFQTLGRWQLTQAFEYTEICMASVSSMWSAIAHFWPYFDQIPVNWQQSLPELLSACTEQDFQQKTSRIYEEFTKLKDNHISISVQTPEQELLNKYVPFVYELVEGKAIVVRVQENLETGIEIGDELLKINDLDIQTYLAEKAVTSLSSDTMRKNSTARYDTFKPSFEPIMYQVAKPNGDIHDISIEPNAISEISNFVGLRYVPLKNTKIEKLADGIYLINVYNVNNEDSKSLKDQLKDAKGVILDMRRYPKDRFGWQNILSWFIKNPAVNDTIYHLWQGAPYQADVKLQRVSQSIQPDEHGFDVPVVAMASRYSQSQNEHSLIFARSGGIPILGEPTSGINGNIVSLEFFNGLNDSSSKGAHFIYTNLRANKLNGDPLINSGIEPDILIPRTIKSHREQVDNQLSAAIDYLKQQIDR